MSSPSIHPHTQNRCRQTIHRERGGEKHRLLIKELMMMRGEWELQAPWPWKTFLGFRFHSQQCTHKNTERREGKLDFFSREGRPFRRASVVWEVKPRTAPPPTQGLLRVRERDKEIQMKNDTKCERKNSLSITYPIAVYIVH